MDVAVTNAPIEQTMMGTEVSSEEMESKSQTGGFSIANLAISILALILGIVGGLLASVANNAEWKGKMEQRIEQLERQRMEDKATWDMIRVQNESNGKTLAKIEQRLDGLKGR